MPSVCHSVVRAPAARVVRLGSCGELPTSESNGCDYATTESFTEIALSKVLQERQDALQLNANGDICVDKPKAPILRWYEVTITFCNVDPELFNIVSAEPLIYNDAVAPEAVGWCTLPDSPSAANFSLEFWTNLEDDCEGDAIQFGYGVLPRITQGMIGDVTFGNNVVNFTVTGITRGGNQWGHGPFNVILNETGANAGLPTDLLVSMNTQAHKCFQWTKLGPPPGECGCQDITPVFTVAPTSGAAAVVRVGTFPLDGNGDPILPGVIDWGDLSVEEVTTGTSANHTYAAGTYHATFIPTGYSGPTYTSATITVTP